MNCFEGYTELGCSTRRSPQAQHASRHQAADTAKHQPDGLVCRGASKKSGEIGANRVGCLEAKYYQKYSDNQQGNSKGFVHNVLFLLDFSTG
jgi:hypothetical protein